MVNCGKCNKIVKDNERRTCSLCLQAYHIKCVKGDEETWKCPKCVTEGKSKKTPKITPSSSMQGEQEPQQDISKQLSELKEYINIKFDALLHDLSSKVNSVESSVTKISQQYCTLLDKINNLNTDITDMKACIDFQEDTISDLKQKVSVLEADNKSLTNKLTVFENKMSDFEGMKRSLNEVEQRARLNNLEVFGVPERKTEDLVTLMLSVSTAVGEPITKEDMEYVTRVPSRIKTPGLPKTIVVRFKSTLLKDKLLSAARKKRGLTSTELGIPGDSKQIFINEHLTSDNKALLKAAREKCKELGFSYIWTRNSKIYVRQHDKTNAFRIYHVDQVNKMKIQTPS